jgi:hypothetical protein
MGKLFSGQRMNADPGFSWTGSRNDRSIQESHYCVNVHQKRVPPLSHSHNENTVCSQDNFFSEENLVFVCLKQNEKKNLKTVLKKKIRKKRKKKKPHRKQKTKKK